MKIFKSVCCLVKSRVTSTFDVTVVATIATVFGVLNLRDNTKLAT